MAIHLKQPVIMLNSVCSCVCRVRGYGSVTTLTGHAVSRNNGFARTGGCRRTIITQISPTTSILRSDTCDNEVYLLGTAHISESSANEVRQLAEVVRPQQIFIELDPARAARLRASVTNNMTASGATNAEDYLEKMIHDAIKNYTKASAGGGPGGMPPFPPLPRMPGGGFGGGGGAGGGGPQADWLKAGFQSFYKVLKQYGYVPGVEMLAAMDEADRINADIFYGDVNADETLRDLRAALNPSMLMRAISTPPPAELAEVLEGMFTAGGSSMMDGMGDRVEALKTRENARQMTKWMEQALPEIATVMIHKRDKYMAANLRRHCSQGKVLAVVGLAHVDGIEREWQRLGEKSTASLPQ